MHIMLFWHKRKIDHFKPYNVFLAIATNPSVLLMTGFVVQGHIKYVLIILFLIQMDLLLLHQYLMVQYGSYSYSKEIIENKLEPAEPSWKKKNYKEFFYLLLFCDLYFQTTKKAHDNKYSSEGYFCELFIFFEKCFNCLAHCVRQWEKHLMYLYLIKKEIDFIATSALWKSNTIFPAQTLIDVRRSMITGGVECTFIQMKVGPQEPLRLYSNMALHTAAIICLILSSNI